MSDSVCAFSGHRLIFRSHKDSLPALLSDTVDALINSGIRRFLSGGALGFDMLAAETILKKKREGLDIELKMILPCRNQPDRWDFASRKRYSDILENADDVFYVSEKYDQFCMKARNRRLIDESDILLCYLTREHSGTSYTKDYAEMLSRKIINLADLF